MNDDNQTTIDGDVMDVFAHRFVVRTAHGNVLADLGPKGAELVALKSGDRVEVTGEMKPSELKASRIAVADGEPVAIAHHKPKHDAEKGHGDGHHEDADPKAALRTVEANGFTVVGEPRRKPKHFGITGRDGAGDLVELHVALDGTLRKTKPLKLA